VALRATVEDAEGGARVVVANDGTGDASEVEVRLLHGERVLDRVTLHRVPAGEQVVALLGAGGRAEGPAEVVVDGAARYAPEPQRLPVTLPPDRETPAPGLALLLLGALLVAAARPRR
jgi:hypothetical protein